jgi:hypothetical protein
MEIYDGKSQKTQSRIRRIKADIKMHSDSMLRLKYFYTKNFNKSELYAPRKIKYSDLPRSEERYRSSMNYIAEQLKILEQELAALIEYGK